MSSPADHYAAAEHLLNRVTDMDATLPICRALVSQAHVHALLATYTPPPDPYRDYSFHDGYSMRNNTRIARAKEEFL